MSQDAPIVDIEGFRAMMRDAGIEEAVESTLEVYLEEAPPTFGRLNAASAAGDMETAAAAAHALKSASSNIWATPLVQLMDMIEHSARDGDAVQVAELLERAVPVYEAVVERVRSER